MYDVRARLAEGNLSVLDLDDRPQDVINLHLGVSPAFWRDYKSLLTDHRQHPPPYELTLAIDVYGDGCTPRGRPNVNMKFALVGQYWQFFLHLPGSGNLARSTPMLTWRELPKRDFESWPA